MTLLNWTIASWVIFALALAWPAWLAARRLARRRRCRVRCEACRYDLRGTSSSRCPECGHDITTPARLIRFRALLLHGMVTFLLLTAAHLVNRIEGIQKRGWIAAVPTTVLIAYLPLERGPLEGTETVAGHELLVFRARRPDRSRSPGLSGGYRPRYPMAKWQWWCAIELALGCEYRVFGERSGWACNAEYLLNAAESYDAATPRQLRRILDIVVVEMRTRPQWPLGREMRGDLGVLCIESDIDYQANPLAPHQDLMSFTPPPMGSGLYPDWYDHSDVLGVANALGPVRYEFVISRRDNYDEPWRELTREIRVVTTIVPADTQLLQPINVDESALGQIGVRMRILDRAFARDERCLVYLDFVRSPVLLSAMGDGTLAARIRLNLDREMVSERAAWWSNRLPWMQSEDRHEWIIEFSVPDDLLERARVAGDTGWSVEFVSDADLALNDFESTSFWAGRYEFKSIPVERVESGK